MNIEFSLFIGVFLSLWIITGFIFESVNNRQVHKAQKKFHLEKRICEVCSSVYFVTLHFEFWHCPFCNSINKEK